MISSIQLTEGQTYLLVPPQQGLHCVGLTISTGITRISGSFGNNFHDITLGFCGDSDQSWFSMPNDSNLLLEALTAASIKIEYLATCPHNQDLMSQWLFDLHLVRHPIGSEARLVSLFQLLVSRFGVRRGDGYFLPFSLGHARIAELIGATRSTVTRQMSLLRQQQDLNVNNSQGHYLLSSRLIEQSIEY